MNKSLQDMDIEAFLNIRDWFMAAITEHGGKIVDTGMGVGKADLGVELEGYEYSLSIRPRIAMDQHDSDCATHNMPAYPNEPCDCSLQEPK